MTEPKTGEHWLERRSDPPRVVEIEGVDPRFVYYHTVGQRWFPPSLRSRMGRFMKAYELQVGKR